MSGNVPFLNIFLWESFFNMEFAMLWNRNNQMNDLTDARFVTRFISKITSDYNLNRDKFNINSVKNAFADLVKEQFKNYDVDEYRLFGKSIPKETLEEGEDAIFEYFSINLITPEIFGILFEERVKLNEEHKKIQRDVRFDAGNGISEGTLVEFNAEDFNNNESIYTGKILYINKSDYLEYKSRITQNVVAGLVVNDSGKIEMEGIISKANLVEFNAEDFSENESIYTGEIVYIDEDTYLEQKNTVIGKDSFKGKAKGFIIGNSNQIDIKDVISKGELVEFAKKDLKQNKSIYDNKVLYITRNEYFDLEAEDLKNVAGLVIDERPDIKDRHIKYICAASGITYFMVDSKEEVDFVQAHLDTNVILDGNSNTLVANENFSVGKFKVDEDNELLPKLLTEAEEKIDKLPYVNINSIEALALIDVAKTSGVGLVRTDQSKGGSNVGFIECTKENITAILEIFKNKQELEDKPVKIRLNTNDEDTWKDQIEAIKEATQTTGHNNVYITIPNIRTEADLEKIDKVKKQIAGTGIKIAIMVENKELARNENLIKTLTTDDKYKIEDFCLGTNDLTLSTLGKNNTPDTDVFQINERVFNVIENFVTIAKKYNPNVEIICCGKQATDQRTIINLNNLEISASVPPEELIKTAIFTAQYKDLTRYYQALSDDQLLMATKNFIDTGDEKKLEEIQTCVETKLENLLDLFGASRKDALNRAPSTIQPLQIPNATSGQQLPLLVLLHQLSEQNLGIKARISVGKENRGLPAR